MKMLGFRSLHWAPSRLAAVVLGKETEPNFRIYDDCEFICDIPHAYFFREIGMAYPELKYILTERNEDDWFRSMCSHYLGLKTRLKAQEITEAVELMKTVYGECAFDEVPNRPFLLKKRFRDWNATVRAAIPPANLLAMNICDGGDGWKELCPFVGRTEPDTAFPHKNKS